MLSVCMGPVVPCKPPDRYAMFSLRMTKEYRIPARPTPPRHPSRDSFTILCPIILSASWTLPFPGSEMKTLVRREVASLVVSCLPCRRSVKWVNKSCFDLPFFQILFGFLAPADEANGALCCNGNVSFFFGVWRQSSGYWIIIYFAIVPIICFPIWRYNWVRLGWFLDVKRNLLRFLGSWHRDAPEGLHDVTRFVFGPTKRSGSACFVMKHIWTTGDIVQNSSVSSLFSWLF
jgi:hypothetical protein